jgi:hypothetical protein
MKKATLPIFLAIYILSFCNIGWANPILSIPEPDFDFGFVPQNAKISHVFWLHSTGTDSLRIENVRPG